MSLRAKLRAKNPAMKNDTSPSRWSARWRAAALGASSASASICASGLMRRPSGVFSYSASARENMVSRLTTYCSDCSSISRFLVLGRFVKGITKKFTQRADRHQ